MTDSAIAEAAPPAGERSGRGASVDAAGTAGRIRRRALLLGLAVASGLVLSLAFPSTGWWPLAPVSVALLALACRDLRPRHAALLGLLAGLGFFVPHLAWSGIYVGKLPWFALAGVESLYVAAMAALLPWAWRAPVRPLGSTVAIGGLWVGQELVRGSWPFGGFPWGRLAFSQDDAPAAGLAALGGAPLVTFAVAAAGALLAWALVAALPPRHPDHPPTPSKITVSGSGRPFQRASGPRDSDLAGVGAVRVGAVGAVGERRVRRPVAAALALVAGAGVIAAGGAVPRPTAGEPLRVAAVQGNVPRAGLDFNAERRAVTDNHARATIELARRVAAGQAPQPDLVIWPENASDIDPLRNADAGAVIQQAVDEIGVPTVLGAVLQQPVGKVSNASIVWSPRTGPGETYIKQHPVPFGEYIPYRSFFRRISDKVDLVARDFQPGDREGLLDAGGVRLGTVICFEVAYDGLVRQPVRDGAQLIAVQTNNATFGRTDESVQQLAMSRLRAIESGRSVVHISTVGISAIIEPDGTVVRRSGHFTQEVLEADVPLRTGLTPATRLGALPEWSLAGLGLVLALAGGLSAAVTGRRRRGNEA